MQLTSYNQKNFITPIFTLNQKIIIVMVLLLNIFSDAWSTDSEVKLTHYGLDKAGCFPRVLDA